MSEEEVKSVSMDTKEILEEITHYDNWSNFLDHYWVRSASTITTQVDQQDESIPTVII